MQILCGIFISDDLQRKRVDTSTVKNLEHLIKSLDLADTIPTKSESTGVGLLIGNDCYLDLILLQKTEIAPGLYFLSSKLGWILSGRTQDYQVHERVPNMLILTHSRNIAKTSVFQQPDSVVPVKPNLDDFWNMESIGIRSDLQNSDDESALQTFRESLKYENGRYHVAWPWKDEVSELPENKELAFGRLKSCLKKMKDKPEWMQKYDGVLQYQLSKGIIEKVYASILAGLRHYIPHHFVITP